jgi:twinkle protein
MANILPDSFDFTRYLRDTECKAKVRPAAVFRSDLIDSFRERGDSGLPRMESTKLRHLIEFRPGEVTVWGGYNGHRKSMFLGQAVLDIMRSEPVLIASMEMSPATTLHRMARQACAAARPYGVDLDRFLAWSDSRLWLFDHSGRVDAERMLAVIRYFAEELEGRHIVIDSLMMVCASEESLDEQKQLVTDLVRSAQEYGVHVHLVAHMRKPAQGGEDKPPTKYELRGSAAISDQAANVITVWANKAKDERNRNQPNPHDPEPDALVSVLKQRNGEHEGSVKLWFDRGSLRFMDELGMTPKPFKMGGA